MFCTSRVWFAFSPHLGVFLIKKDHAQKQLPKLPKKIKNMSITPELAETKSAKEQPPKESLEKILGLNATRSHYKEELVPFDQINVLPQGRKTFDVEELHNLSDSIAEEGLIQPPLIIRFDSEAAEKYLFVINGLWGTQIRLADLKPTTDKEDFEKQVYYILVAGERRYRSMKILQDVGCSECQETYGEGNCYSRHFEDHPDMLEARVGENVAPIQAIYRQASENIHNSLPPHEEADYYNHILTLVRIARPEYPLSKFAKKVGRSESKIRDSLRYTNLPSEVKSAVEGGHLPYGMAVEIARMAEQKVEPDDINFYTKRAMAGNLRVDDFKKTIMDYLRNRSSGQVSLLDLFSAEQIQSLEKLKIKKVVEKEIIKAMWSWIYYFSKVNALFEDGKLGEEESPFSSRSPIKVFRRLLAEQQRLMPHLKSVTSRRIYEETAAQLESQIETVAAIVETYEMHGIIIEDATSDNLGVT